MSDEVSDFLRSVELLKGRREEEDEARSRELEEKILQDKRERQARRAGTQRTPIPSLPSHRSIFGPTCRPPRFSHSQSRSTSPTWLSILASHCRCTPLCPRLE